MSRVVTVSREELEDRRRSILSGVGLSCEELRDRAASSTLIGDEWEAWQELRDVEFLLGDV